MLFDFASVLAFTLVGGFFVLAGLLTSALIRPRVPTTEKAIPYECGERPVGLSWVRFNLRFYLIAIIFLLFDVEVALLLPWAVVFRKLGLPAFLEAMTFVAILLVGLAYVWAKGDLEWDKGYRAEAPPTETAIAPRKAA